MRKRSRIISGQKKFSRGYSLVEFMMASLVTLVMLASAFTMLNTIFLANGGMGETLSTQQNARVAMNMMGRDIVMAGTGLPSTGIAIPNGTGADALTRPGLGGSFATPNNVMATLTPGNGGGPSIASVATDALTIVSIDQDSPSWTISTITPIATSTTMTFSQNVRSGAFQLFAGDLLLITNVNGSVFGAVTAVSTTIDSATFADNDPLNLNQPGAAFGKLASLANPGSSPLVFPPTTATRINVISYYINNSVTAHPKLMRSVNSQAAQVIVEDVENLQFSYDLYDFLTNTDAVDLATTTTPDQIRAVHVSITCRSSKTINRTGNYYRFNLASKVNVRNATFRNRYTGT